MTRDGRVDTIQWVGHAVGAKAGGDHASAEPKLALCAPLASVLIDLTPLRRVSPSPYADFLPCVHLALLDGSRSPETAAAARCQARPWAKQ